MTGTLTNWKNRLKARQDLLADARKQHSWNPTAKSRAKVVLRRAQVAYAQRVVNRHSGASLYSGARAVTNEVIDIVNGRAPVTSRKRSPTHPLSLANPGSDHSGLNRTADAVDFGIAEAHWLKNEISRKLGGPGVLPDYGTFTVNRNGRHYRVQIIAGTHGTGPHLHVGVKRI